MEETKILNRGLKQKTFSTICNKEMDTFCPRPVNSIDTPEAKFGMLLNSNPELKCCKSDDYPFFSQDRIISLQGTLCPAGLSTLCHAMEAV